MVTFSNIVHLKNKISYNFIIVLLVFIISGCSTKKNTWSTRAFQDISTRYNVYFNGTLSYNEGLKNILKANKEDYSNIIPMYPISHHSNASSATTNMDRTIEKCRKAIKLHSIKIKPEKDYKKWNNPDYKLFYNQEEFNPALKQAWILLGQAEFHKADFLGAVGTFTYIARHYSLDRDIIATCQLWIVRAYGEMGWIYEAEQVLSKIKQDDLKQSNIGLFASVNADLLLKKHIYKEAIPFLQLALSKEKDKDLIQRFSYLLAQLYQKTGDNQEAFSTFTKVIKMNPPFEMDFNARINRAQLTVGNIESVRKDLRNMLKNSNNKDYIDQIYYALGNTYFQRGDTAKAIENFKLSISKSTRNGLDKGLTLITLGDIYYKKRNYVAAQPCYDEAGKIISNENEDYGRVTRLGETLSELVTQNDVVVLQDSLQRLSLLPESKRIEVVNKIIEKLIADEKAAADKATKDAQDAINESEIGNMPPIGMNVPAGTGSWYFYNPDIIRSGQVEFIKKWGKRKLEDNWRRANKSASLFNDNITKNVAKNDSDSTATGTKIAAITDYKKPEFYLKQIPITPAQIQKSNDQIADALYAMGQIYKDKIEDYPLAINTFNQFITRFGSDARVPDAYFQMYMIETKNGNQSQADFYKNKLVSDFPNSKYHAILAQPDYAARMEKMYQEQDSVYNLTYKAYNDNDFNSVFKNVEYIRKNYPLSTLMPKFLFLNALSIGKKESPEKFKTALDSLVTNYPLSDVSSMAKDIMALIKQGKESKTGTTSGTLLARREESTKTEINEINPQQFSADKQGKHRVLLICSDSISEMNKLQYNIASFNFSRFLIKDFDLAINKLDSTEYALSITNLDSYDEAQWYLNTLNSDLTISTFIQKMKVREIIISEDNYGLLRTSLNLNDYLAFLNGPKSKVQTTNEVAVKQSNKKEQKPVKEIQKEAIVQNITKPVDVKPENNATKTIEKPIVKQEIKPIENTVKTADSTSTTVTKGSKPVDIPTKKVEIPVQKAPEPVKVQPKEEVVPLFKGLYGYRANEPHFIAIDVLSGKFDFEKVKAAFDAYNSQNYGIMNLKLSLESINNQQVIIIGSFSNAQIAKSYLLRMVKENSLFVGLKGADYRNLLGSQKNLNVAIQQPSLNTYFDFMQEYYLK
jgi:tetratricopeptide (TPR) repeat protein